MSGGVGFHRFLEGDDCFDFPVAFGACKSASHSICLTFLMRVGERSGCMPL